MKRILTLFLIILSCALANAQDHRGPRFNPQEYKEKLECYITQHACLTQAEAEKFFPLFLEMKMKQRDLMQKAQKLKRMNNCDNVSSKEYAERVNEIMDITVEAAKTAQTYYKKFCKVIPAEKVYKAMLADDSFHRDMLRKLKK